MSNVAQRLNDALTAAGIPIFGVSVGRVDDKSSWRIDFADGATADQKTAAEQVVAAFDVKEPASHYLVDKSIVVQRLIAANKINAAYAALTSNAAYFARWFAPGHPNVYADDPDALTLLAAIGADPKVILAP